MQAKRGCRRKLIGDILISNVSVTDSINEKESLLSRALGIFEDIFGTFKVEKGVW